ncbi:DEAD/DEAH box helicase family protein [Aquirufa antheringensis]|uniref:DEAD/DEAH box helicase family protein n=1 Tax=Aquirufa antheringensis TaxID=2516559 RepID=UPI003BAEB814
MEFQIAHRKRAKIKMAIQGHSGSGKTYSALLVAHGLSQSWGKVAVIVPTPNYLDTFVERVV